MMAQTVSPGNGSAARQHLEQQHAEREDVRLHAAGCPQSVPVTDSPDGPSDDTSAADSAIDGQLDASPLPVQFRSAGNPEVEDFKMPRPADHHVRRLHVAMDDARLVRSRKRRRNLDRVVDGEVDREASWRYRRAACPGRVP